jgi:gamma-glutamylputrescine oxidase
MSQVSFWEKESFYGPKDVVIVGSGFVGLWSAYYLKKLKPKLSVTIVDRGIIPTGASTRNAGFACFGSVTELIADTLEMGENSMLELVEMRYRGLNRIRKLFSNREINFEDLGGYELISKSQGMDINILRSNIDWLNHKLRKILKSEKAFHAGDNKIHDFGFKHTQYLIENRFEGQLHPGLLCQALLRKVQSMGVNVLNAIEIKGFEQKGEGVELHTNQSFNLKAAQVLVCTNAFAKELLPNLEIEPARGQILVSSAIPDLKFKGAFHHDQGFYYFRNLGTRVLLGGARNKAFEEEHTSELSLSDTIQDELERFLREIILPGVSFSIDHRWSGIMGVGREKLPVVEQVNEHVFCAVRMGGMGVALAPVVGEQIAGKMTGK